MLLLLVKTPTLNQAVEYHEKYNKLHHLKTSLEEKINNEHFVQTNENESNDQEDDICFASQATEALQDFEATAAQNDGDLQDLIPQLNSDQLRVFNYVTSALKSGTPLRHFTSGVGGTGKSFLIQSLKVWVKEELQKEVAVTAPTGLAACQVSGHTIHKLLQLPVEHGTAPRYSSLSDAVLQIIRLFIKKIGLLIIDEISMVSNVLLPIIHLRLSEIMNVNNAIENAWFGNVPILGLGDLLQLSPVNGKQIFLPLTKDDCEKCLSSLGGINLWEECFTYGKLTINMRQKEDKEFAELLLQVRLGFCSTKTKATLESHLIPFTASSSVNERLEELSNFVHNSSANSVSLFPVNAMSDTLNSAVLDRLQGETIILKAEDFVSCKSLQKKKPYDQLRKLDDDSSQTAGLEHTIQIKIGSKVMLRQNKDLTKGFANGAIGTVLQVLRGVNNKPETIEIQFNRGILSLSKWTVKFQLFLGVFVYRTQFPITLAYGISIHKGQSLSIESCNMDIGNRISTAGQSYVALSRVTSLNGVNLINFDPSKIKASELAIKEYNRLRAKYTPHLGKLKVIQSKQKISPDRMWTGFNDIDIGNALHPGLIQDSRLQHNLPSFQNSDSVSCYANASLQCLLSIECITSFLKKEQENPDLQMLASQYALNVSPLSAYNVRTSLGNEFTRHVQQDAADFLLALINTSETLQNHSKFTQFLTRHCHTCSYKTETQAVAYILQLYKSPKFKTISQLVSNMSSPEPLEGSVCESCHIGRAPEHNS